MHQIIHYEILSNTIGKILLKFRFCSKDEIKCLNNHYKKHSEVKRSILPLLFLRGNVLKFIHANPVYNLVLYIL